MIFTTIHGTATPAGNASFSLPEDVVLLIVEDGSSRLLHLNRTFLGLDFRATQALLSGVGLRSITDDQRTLDSSDCRNSLISGSLDDRDPEFKDRLCERLCRQRLLNAVGEKSVGAWFDALAVRLQQRILRIVFGKLRKTRVLDSIGLSLIGFMVRLAGLGRTIRVAVAMELPRNECATVRRSPADLISERVGLLKRASRSWWPISCKEKAIVAFLKARSDGLNPRLVLGVDLFPFRAHLWCDCQGEVLSDAPDECREFQVAAVWPTTGVGA